MAMAFDDDDDDDDRFRGKAPDRFGKAGRNESLISVTSEGGSAVAEETMQRAATSIAAGVRRAIPFLGRRRATAVATTPSTVRANTFGKELEDPFYVCSLAAEPGGSRAMLALDAAAIAFLLEGMLGGDGSDSPKLAKKGLSAPQRAFIDRIVGNIVTSVSSSLAKALGLSLTKLPQLMNERPADGVVVMLPIEFHDAAPKTVESKKDFSLDDFEMPSKSGASSSPGASGDATVFGTMFIAVSKTALIAARAANLANRVEHVDPRLAASLRQVEVSVVAELGRVRLTLGGLSALRVGDTLRLDVPVEGDVDVRVEDQPLFRGQPTTHGSQLAIQVTECRTPEFPREPQAPRLGDSELPPARGGSAPKR
ncbi:MAG: FliM/FliN family flagellar motor switch protein [Deltaproteobacteria bacterium]|nr:FliM/FliN family flagellar motor switch protein [Deltaproteobacteria bacterium]